MDIKFEIAFFLFSFFSKHSTALAHRTICLYLVCASCNATKIMNNRIIREKRNRQALFDSFIRNEYLFRS